VSISKAKSGSSKHADLRVTRVEAYTLRDKGEGKAHWVSHFKVPHANELLARLCTDAGIDGLGLATSCSSTEPFVHCLRTGLGERVL
jgi:hypothetical protein